MRKPLGAGIERIEAAFPGRDPDRSRGILCHAVDHRRTERIEIERIGKVGRDLVPVVAIQARDGTDPEVPGPVLEKVHHPARAEAVFRG